MKHTLRMTIRGVGLSLARLFASNIYDYATGERIGRALLLPWRGKVYVIGLEPAVRPVFLPQKRLTYWKQELGFTQHPAPDFPRERGSTSDES